jgi:hypothetical protein
MAYTSEQASVLMRLHGMLDAQRPWKERQFKDMIVSLLEQGVTEEKIAKALEVPPFFVKGWSLGLRIPPKEEWEPIIIAVLSLIDKELELTLDV